MNDYLKNPLWLLAAGGAFGLALWGLLVGLSHLLPAFGVMISLMFTGAAAGFTIAPAMGAIASYGAAATGAALTVQLVVRITREAKKEPLAWGTPILGVVSGFLVQMSEQFWKGPKIAWLVFSVATGLLVVIGGILYGQKRVFLKIVGALTSLVAPASVLAAVAYSRPEPLTEFIFAGGVGIWLPLTLLLLVAVILAVLAHVSATRDP